MKRSLPDVAFPLVANLEAIRDDAAKLEAPEMAEGDETVSGSTPPVFISYASRDGLIAAALVEALEQHDIACWIAPRDVKAGALYADAIIRAINAAKASVLVLSENSITSSHVRKEIERASAKKCPIIALRIDAAPLTPMLEYFLSESQWVEVQGGNIGAAHVKLIDALREPARAVPENLVTVAPGASTGAPSAAHPKSRRNRIVLAGVLAVAVAFAAPLANKLWLPERVLQKESAATVPVAAAIPVRSVAVLPFADMSETQDQEYFADGMAEEIIDLLAKIPSLTVIGRTSSFQFKAKSEDLRTIGAKLSATYVVQGSVRKSGDHVRVTAQLIDTRTGAHQWSETFDRNLGDILKLQDEIAGGLARALQVTIGDGDLQPRGNIRNPEAYQFYLRGRHAFDRYDRDGDDEAAADFQKALDLEPNFANAAGYLAMTRVNEAMNGFMSYASGFEDARRWAEVSLHLDPSSAIGHCVLADYYIRFAWDWKAAAQEAKRAMELDSRGVMPVTVSANLAATLGNWDEAIRLLNTALELDPLNAALYWDLGNTRYRSGRLPEAEAAFRRILQISPTFVSAHFELGRVLAARGQVREALQEMEQESPEPESGRTAGLAMIYYLLARRADSDAALRRLEAESAGDWPFGLAETYAFRGEADQAFHWLDRAYIQKDELELLKGDPTFRKIEHDSRYIAFLRKMNLLE